MKQCRRVNRALIDAWVAENGPDGVAQLALKSRISTSMISKVRIGRVPARPITRRILARALNVSEDVLFPLEAEEAS